jgi:S1-C subfamily serine protease
MRKTLLMCVFSALAGGLAAIALQDGRLADSNSAAQEPAPLPVQGGYPNQPVPAAQPPVGVPAATPEAAAALDALTPEERINVLVYQQVNRSVVNINTEGGDRFFMFEIESKGEGSGCVIDRAGHILTNFHVIEGAREISVTLFDGKIYPAKPVGGDAETDVAVLKIDAPADSLFPVVFGSSANLLVGQRVFAIGNPFGLERTLTTGIISSLDRSLPTKHGRREMKSIIQIDAAINPGNSGGPLLDGHARMIGMNTAIASKTGENTGVGFAIPINTIARVVPQLIQNGRVRRPESGIARVYQTDRGLLILNLVHGGAAERAGLQGPLFKREQTRQGQVVVTRDLAAADMIVAVDGKPIKTTDDFLDAIEAKQPGDQVTITTIRAGQQRQVPLRLEAAN